MCGLPARGKSYLSNKLTRYLKWLEYDVRVFNVGQLRRRKARTRQQMYGEAVNHDAGFFDPGNPDAAEERQGLADECLEGLIEWLREGGNVGIHDATNTTMERRATIEARVKREPGMKLIFLESICTDASIVAANIAVKVNRLSSIS